MYTIYSMFLTALLNRTVLHVKRTFWGSMSFGTATFSNKSAQGERAALEKIEYAVVPGEFNFYRPAVCFLQLMKDFFHKSRYGGFGKKVVESYTGAGGVDFLVFEKRRRKMPFIINRDNVIKVGMIDLSGRGP